MRSLAIQSMEVNGRRVEYRLVGSRSAHRLRIRVGLNGVEVVQPAGRKLGDVEGFLAKHRGWIAEQMERVERLRVVHKPPRGATGEILYRGVLTPVRVHQADGRRGRNQVMFDGNTLVVRLSEDSRTTAARSLENWLRKQARIEIKCQLETMTVKLRRIPNRLYVMGQRTKWGNCSALHNLSFSWRLIMAPECVRRYLVTHEAVHLAVPDHSTRFWLTVQSLCPETEPAKQWLTRNGEKLPFNLG